MKKLIVEKSINFTKYGVIENKKVVFLDVIANSKEEIKLGEIFIGEVEKYIPGLEAAFVNIGNDSGFLQTKKKYIKGQKLLVQILKEPVANKKAKLTEDISISGINIVLLKSENKVKLPRELQKNENLLEYKKIVEQEYPNTGILFRSTSVNKNYEEISKEIKFLNEITERFEDLNQETGLLYTPNSQNMIIEKLANKFEVKEIITNDIDYVKKNKIIMSRNGFQLIVAQNLTFDYNGININDYLHNYFKYKDFGLFVDKTEALTVFDIDSGYNSDNKLKNNHSLFINKQAILETLKLLELLNLGGIIIIDLITINEEQREELNQFILKETGKYGKNISCAPISRGSLLEITRRKAGQSILEKLTKKCDFCKGSGRVYNSKYLIDTLELQLKSFASNYSQKEVQIIIPRVYYSVELNKEILNLSESLGLKADCIVSDDFNKQDIYIKHCKQF